MEKIIKSNIQFKFVPLINLKKAEIIKLLSESKIYMDFGFFIPVRTIYQEKLRY